MIKTVMTSFVVVSLFASSNMANASENNNNNEPRLKRTKNAPGHVLIDLTGQDRDITTAEESPLKRKKSLGEQEQGEGFLSG